MAFWTNTLNSYQLGRERDALEHAQNALKAAEPSSLVSSAHCTNIAALRNSQEHLPPLPTVPAGCTIESFFRCEVALTRGYNHGLSLAKSGKVSAAIEVLEESLGYFSDTHLPSADALISTGMAALPRGTSIEFVRRVCEAYAAVLQLRSALFLMDTFKDTSAAYELAEEGTKWLRASASLSGSATSEKCEGDAMIARGIGLQSLARAASGTADKFEELGSYVSEQLADGNDTGVDTSWPAVYQHAAARALQALSAGVSDRVAISQLDACSRAGYRSADALSLIGRLERESERSLLAFEGAISLDYSRPALLMVAAHAFGETGDRVAQSELLACARQVLGEGMSSALESDEKVHLVKRWIPEIAEVDLARAEALILAKKPSNAWELIESVPDNIDVIRKMRILAIVNGQIQGIEEAHAAAKAYKDACNDGLGSSLLFAEAKMNMGDVEASRKIMESCKSTASYSEITETVGRGLWYNNHGVTLLCLSEDDATAGAEDAFKAAQSAFDKVEALDGCTRVLAEWARSASDAATWNRTLLKAELGNMEDAVSHWLGRRKGRMPNGETEPRFSKPLAHVMGDVDQGSKAAMDELCRKVERSTGTQVGLSNVLKLAGSRWNSTNNRS